VYRVLTESLRLMHPFLPFVTEELWGHLPGTDGPLIAETWATDAGLPPDEEAEGRFDLLRDVVTSVRNIRSEMGLPPQREVRVLVRTDDAGAAEVLGAARDVIAPLGRIAELAVGTHVEKPHAAASAVVRGGTVYVPLEGLIDLDVERRRLGKERDRLSRLIEGSEKKLANESFVSRAKPEVVAREREKLESLRGDLAKVAAALEDLA
jgi:valyl-tRNA synthetase